jgi:hypothetical protein
MNRRIAQICYVCGRPFVRAVLPGHERECRKKRAGRVRVLPAALLPAEPTLPAEPMPSAADGDDAWRRYNDDAWTSYLASTHGPPHYSVASNESRGLRMYCHCIATHCSR